MRLNQTYIKTIKKYASEIFGENSQVFLFGSRVDDSQKGGDIDLYIKVEDKTHLFEKKMKFLAKIKRILGDQKIDVVFNEDNSRLIEQEIKKCRIML